MIKSGLALHTILSYLTVHMLMATTATENIKFQVKIVYPTPSKRTRSGFSCPDSWTEACRRGKLRSAGCPGQDTQPDPPGTGDLSMDGGAIQALQEEQHQQWIQ